MNKKVIAAGVVPVCYLTGRVLLIRRGFDQPSPNTWSVFGGKFEKSDEEPIEAAKREFKEESGVVSGKYFLTTSPIHIYDDNHLRFYSFLGMFKDEFVPDIEKENEAQDFCWFDLDNIPHNIHSGLREMFEEKLNDIKEIIDLKK